MSAAICVAIVEDDAPLRAALENLMRSTGFVPVTFATAEHFLAERHDIAPDVIVCDFGLPGLSGIGLIQALHNADYRCAVIIISGHADPGLVNRAITAGAVAFLPKPFDADVLVDLIQANARGA